MCLSCVRKAHMSSKKLLEQCQKLEKLWGHVLTGNYAASNQPATATTREITQKYPSQTTILSYIPNLSTFHKKYFRHAAAPRWELVHEGDGPAGEAADGPHLDVGHQGNFGNHELGSWRHGHFGNNVIPLISTWFSKLHALLWPSIIVSPDGCNLKERLMYLNFLFI